MVPNASETETKQSMQVWFARLVRAVEDPLHGYRTVPSLKEVAGSFRAPFSLAFSTDSVMVQVVNDDYDEYEEETTIMVMLMMLMTTTTRLTLKTAMAIMTIEMIVLSR